MTTIAQIEPDLIRNPLNQEKTPIPKTKKISKGIIPSPSLSNKLNASLNSAIWSSVSWSAISQSQNPIKHLEKRQERKRARKINKDLIGLEGRDKEARFYLGIKYSLPLYTVNRSIFFFFFSGHFRFKFIIPKTPLHFIPGKDFNRVDYSSCSARTIKSNQFHIVCALHEEKTVLLKLLPQSEVIVLLDLWRVVPLELEVILPSFQTPFGFLF